MTPFAQTPRRAWILWAAAVSLLALLAVVTFAIEREKNEHRHAEAELINISGRQRMLSQRIAYLGTELAGAEPAQAAGLRRQLAGAIALMRTAHRGLTRGDAALGLPGATDPAIVATYFGDAGLDARVRQFLTAADGVAGEVAPSPTGLHLLTVQNAASGPLLRDLDLVVALETARAEAQAASLSRFQLGVLIATLLTLAAEGLLVFMPLLRGLFRQVAVTRLVHDVADAANGAADDGEAFGRCMDLVCAHMDWPVGHAYIADGDELLPTDLWHADDAPGMDGFRRASARSFRRGVGLPGRVLATGRPAWIPDVTQELNFPRLRAAERAGLRAGMAFPVLAGDRVVGALEFFSRRPAAPDARLLKLMEHVGTQLGRVVERREGREELDRRSLVDALTGLANRNRLIDRLQVALRRRGEGRVAVVFVDVDRFKAINDTFGHEAGDTVIREIGRRLEGLSRPSDVVARLGGDEFVVALDGLADDEDAEAIARRLAEAAARRVDLGGTALWPSVSVGVAAGVAGAIDAEELIRNADHAMYAAKEAGGGRVELFDGHLDARLQSRRHVEALLGGALERGELHLAYQPIVGAEAGELAGFEALMRWSSPELGAVRPDVFIPIAESTGLILPLGRWVVREACRRFATLPGHESLRLNVNLSPRQLDDPEFVETVRSALWDSGLRPEQLGLEITETAILEAGPASEQTLLRLREVGVGLILDDFGSGYSALGHLRRLPVDQIKIDRSFIAEIGEGQGSPVILDAIRGMAHALGLSVVAEGVETSAQLDAVQLLGCDFVQGFLFARPMDLGDAADYISARSAVAPV